MAHPLRLVQFSDPHLFGAPGGTLRGVATLPALESAVAHAARHFPARDAVLLTGDLVQEEAGGYELLRQTFGQSAEPVYCLPGNHDLPDAMVELLIGAPFQIGGHAIHDNWLLVMLDTWQAGQAGGRLGLEQLRKLDELLTAHPKLHTLLCLHHHPIAMESRWLDQVGLADSADFQAVVDRHHQVRGVLWGHVHQALDQFTNGVRYMASPATCTQFLPRSDQFALDRRPPGYRILELMPDGSIATEVVWLEADAA